MKYIYVKAFQARHALFDSSFNDLHKGGVKIYDALPNYLLSCFRAIGISWLHLGDKVVFGVFSNWMLPFLPKRNIFLVIHNNLDRRYSFLLKSRETRLLTTCIAQKDIFSYSNYIGHPLPNLKVSFNKSGLLLITDSLEIERVVRSVYKGDIIVKGKYGLKFLPDLHGTLNHVEYCIVDRCYYNRASSIIAMALAYSCKVVLFDKKSVSNLNITWGISCIKTWSQMLDAREISDSSTRENNMKFKERVNFILK